LYTEFVVRRELGQPPSLDELGNRFPHLRVRLERVIQLGDLLGEDAPAALETQRPPSSYSQEPGSERTDTGSWEDRYGLLEKMGRGGMGVVYRARQVSLTRVVALKMMKDGDDATPDERRRFRREAEDMARLRHPHIVQVHAVGERDGLPY